MKKFSQVSFVIAISAISIGALAPGRAFAASSKAPAKKVLKKAAEKAAARTDRLETTASSANTASSATVASYSSEVRASGTLTPPVTAGVSTKAETGASISSPLDRVYLGLTSTFHGTPLRHLDSEFSVDHTGKEKRSSYNALNFDSELGTGYRVSKDIGVGVVLPFLQVVTRGQGFILGDAGLKVYDNRTLNLNGAIIATNLIVQAPTSDGSQANHMTWALKTTPSIRYAVPHSSFTVGSWTEIKDYFGVTKDKTFKLWALPYLNYAVSDGFSLNLGYEVEYHHNVGRKGLGFDAYQTDIQPGFIVGLAKGVSLNPYVLFFTNNKLDSDHAALGAFLSASIL
jgi:hypothetical protein